MGHTFFEIALGPASLYTAGRLTPREEDWSAGAPEIETPLSQVCSAWGTMVGEKCH
jgi:hypothetical protein